uniref:Uncharacterized protein n=1 Tax=Peronospora matthiolae TaxID=2874970 RepID=A0AAV1VAL0_9STRA
MVTKNAATSLAYVDADGVAVCVKSDGRRMRTG